MPTLFKFIGNPDVAKSIASGTVKFTPIAELNDPAELNPVLNREAVESSLNRLRRSGYSEQDMLELRRQGTLLQTLAPEAQAISVPTTQEQANRVIQSSFYDSFPILDRLLTTTAHTIASRVGVFCLSKRFDSLPMWAHYANNAAGFAIEFANLDESFKGDDTGVLRQLREITYTNEIEGVTFDPKSHENLFFSKYSDWGYEQEVRVVLPLSECRLKQLDSGNLYLYDLPNRCINRVILGWNMQQATVDTVKAVLKEENPHVQVVRAQFQRGKVILADI